MAKPFRGTMAIALVFSAIATLGLLLGPLLVRYGIDDGIAKGDSGILRNAVIAYLVVVAMSYVASRQQFVFVNRAGEGFLRLLRINVFGHIQKQSLGFFDRHKSGVLVAPHDRPTSSRCPSSCSGACSSSSRPRCSSRSRSCCSSCSRGS